MEDLAVGGRIAVPRSLPITTQGQWRRHELVVLAGLLAEGNTCHPSCLYFFGNEAALVEDFAAAAAKFPNSVARVYPRSNGRLEVCVSTGRDCRFQPGQAPWNAAHAAVAGQDILPSRSGAYLWAQDMGILGCKAAEKHIPQPVFQLRDADVELFLGRLWAGDGFIASASRAIPPYYATSSQALAEGVQTLLLRLGMVSRIDAKRFKYRGGTRPGFAVRLLGESVLETFMRRIAAHIVGRDAQLQILRQRLLATPPGKTSKDTVPAEVRSWVADERDRAGLTWKELERRSGLSMKEFLGRGSALKRGFRRTTIARLATFFSSVPLAQLAESDIYWDRIVSIEPQGMADTYDLTVEQDHNFVADGIFVHNSHSAAYALVAYQTAWLKAHFPAAFMAAVLSADMDNTDKVVVLIEECREMKLRINPPNINVSQYRFTVNDAGQIVYGLGAIKGVGAAAIEDMLAEREAHGAFQDLQDLCKRVDLRKVNRRVLEALVRAGAFDVFDANRAAHFAALPVVTKIAEQHGKMAETGQNDLFGFAADVDSSEEADENPYGSAVEPWPEDERLAAEKQTLGLYLTGHPIDRYEAELKNFTYGKISALPNDPGSLRGKMEVKIAGLVIDIRTRQSKSGKTMGFILLDDRSGRIEVAAFNETYDKYREVIGKDALLVVEGELGVDDFSGNLRLRAEKIYGIEQARANAARCLNVDWDASVDANPAQAIQALQEQLQAFASGPTAVTVHYRSAQAQAVLQLGERWRVHPSDDLLARLRRTFGQDAVSIKYR